MSRLSRPARLRPHLSRASATSAKQLAEHLPQRSIQRRRARAEEYARGFCDRRHAVRGARLLLCRPDRRAQSRPPAAGAAECARRRRPARSWSTSSPRRARATRPAEAAADKYHGVAKFDVVTGAQAKAKSNAPAYTKVFAESLIEEAAQGRPIVAITAAMPSGTGLDLFAKEFPDRTFDVGIAEQHAVTFAAGLAAEGMQAVLRDLLDLPAARLRPGRARRRHPEACRCASPSTAPASSAPTARPMPAPSTSPISAACPASW